MWIARDKDTSLHLFMENVPIRQNIDTLGFWINPYKNQDRINLDKTLFPEVSWKDNPKEVILEIK